MDDADALRVRLTEQGQYKPLTLQGIMPRRTKKRTPAPYRPVEDYKRFFNRNSDWHGSYTIMLIGFFMGVFSLAIAGHRTVISVQELAQIVVGCCILGMLIPWRLYKKWMGLEKLEVFLFNLLGVGPLLCSLLLWTNFLFHSPAETWVYPVVELEVEREAQPFVTMTLHLQDSALLENVEFRRFDLRPGNVSMLKTDGLLLKTAQGLLGYGIVLDYKPVLIEHQDPALIRPPQR